MLNNEQLATELAASMVLVWIRVAQHSHAQGVDSVLFPDSVTAVSPLEARRRLVKMLDHPMVEDSPDVARIRALSANPKNWSIAHAADSVRDVDRVETLAWAGSLRKTLPGWGGSTPMAWSWAARLLSTPFDEWMPKVRVRSQAVIMNANRQAAAWRWRAYADYYRGFLNDKRKEMRVFAEAVTLLVPAATKLSEREGWFKPVRGDFPLGPVPLTYGDSLSREDREERCIARCGSARYGTQCD